MEAKLKLTAVFEKEEEGGYVAFIEEIPGVNTQGENLDDAKINLLEALELVLDTQRSISENSLINKNVIRESLHLAS